MNMLSRSLVRRLFFSFWLGVSLHSLSVAALQAQTTNLAGDHRVTADGSEPGHLEIDANLSVGGNSIDFGTTTANDSALIWLYTEDTTTYILGLSATRDNVSFLWNENAGGTLQTKMSLAPDNVLSLFDDSGNVGITLSPTSGITLPAGRSLTLSDGTILSGSTSFRQSALYDGSGNAGLSFDVDGNLVVSAPMKLGASGEGIAFGMGTTAQGFSSTAMGINTGAWGDYSTAMGYDNSASGEISTAMGYRTTASGVDSTAIGSHTTASGGTSTAMGSGTAASGSTSTAMGSSTTASGDVSTAMGDSATATGYASTATGNSTTASGSTSTAMGSYTTASGSYSTAMGFNTGAYGDNSTAMGSSTFASGYSSTAMGDVTKAYSIGSLAMGRNNVGFFASGGDTQWIETDPVLEIGNGAADWGTPSNAVTILKNGELRAAGVIQSKAGVRVPPLGDLSMGEFTSGSNPADLDPTLGLRYPTE